jgi:hypothetical protein
MPGVYTVTGTFDIRGSADLVAEGVNVYLACGSPGAVGPCNDDGELGGRVDISAAAPIRVSGADGSLITDRRNTSVIRLGNFE